MVALTTFSLVTVLLVTQIVPTPLRSAEVRGTQKEEPVVATSPFLIRVLIEQRIQAVEEITRADKNQNSLQDANIAVQEVFGVLPVLERVQQLNWDRNGDGRVSDSETRLLFELAYGVRHPDGELLRSDDGLVFDWNHFQMLDRDQDNRLNREEFVEHYYQGPKRSEEMFTLADRDHDGVMTFGELKTLPEFRLDPPDEFARLDGDDNSGVDQDELIENSYPWQQEYARYIFPGFDLDENGLLSLAEYRASPLANPFANWYAAPEDIDCDGRLSFDEYFPRRELSLCGLADLFFRRFDVDGDGFLDTLEHPVVIDFHAIPTEVLHEIRDTNADGMLTLGEAFGNLQPTSNDPNEIRAFELRLLRSEEAFRFCDKDGDERLSRIECIQCNVVAEAVEPASSFAPNNRATVGNLAGKLKSGELNYGVLAFVGFCILAMLVVSLRVRHTQRSSRQQKTRDHARDAAPRLPADRRGVALIDVVVAVLLLSLLACLAFPAIVASREGARNNGCQDNLRQIGQALHNYHATFQEFPCAAVWSTDELESLALHWTKRPDLVTHQNWAQSLLPFFGQQELFESFDFDQRVAAERNTQGRQTSFSLMSCASDCFNRQDNPYLFETQEGKNSLIRFARGNYAINGGTHDHRSSPDSSSSPSGDRPHLIMDRPERRFQFWGNGIAGFNKSFSLGDFANGTSTLVAIEEVRAGVDATDPRGVWAFGQIGGSVTWGHGVNGDAYEPNSVWERSDDILGCARLHRAVGSNALIKAGMPCVSYIDCNQQAASRSMHKGGVNAALLDGSVRFISNRVDPAFWHVIHARETPSDAFDADFDRRLRGKRIVAKPKPVFQPSSAELPLAKEGKKNVPESFENRLGMEFVLIPEGEFTMGLPDGGNNYDIPPESPSHSVRLTRPFYLSCHEVTQSTYETVMKHNPSHHQSKESARFPVEQVSWNDAIEFCKRLSERSDERQAGRRYRLPTEAEWEYACRAGDPQPYKWRSERDPKDDTGETAGISPPLPIVEVGSYRPNPFRLYDMRGNVWEWCADWFERDYYSRSPSLNPQGPADGYIKVVRGGDWIFVGEGCKINYAVMAPWKTNPFVGFRVVCEQASTSTSESGGSGE